MQISFGKKIPIETWNLYDKKKKRFVPATAYHIDAKDESDVAYFDFMEGEWKYRSFIGDSLRRDYSRYLSGRLFEQLHDNDYYSIEAKNGDVACICQTNTHGNKTDVVFIESNEEKRYKYAGQAMLATIAKQAADNDKTMTVNSPVPTARGFYANTCKLKSNGHSGFYLPKDEADAFIKRTEERISNDIDKKSRDFWSFFRKKS